MRPERKRKATEKAKQVEEAVDESENEDEDMACVKCKSRADAAKMLLCDGCETGAYHLYCLKPALDKIPEGDWFCPACQEPATGEASDDSAAEEEEEESADDIPKKVVAAQVPERKSANTKRVTADKRKSSDLAMPPAIDPEASFEDQTQTIIDALTHWSAADLKLFVNELKELETDQAVGWCQSKLIYSDTLPKGKREDMLADIHVIVRAAVVLEQHVVKCIPEGPGTGYRAFDPNRDRDYSHAKPRREQVLDAFARACEKVKASEDVKQRKRARSDESKQVEARLGVMERQQLADLLVLLLDTHPEILPTVEGALPPPDLKPALANAEKMVNAIRRALPNTRWGSSADAFCYRRCAGHVANAKQALVKPVQLYKAAKQWDLVVEYCTKALPLAENMIIWDDPTKRKARDSAIKTLTEAKEQALKHV
uniref:PHD-type domain-containing protein n=1 Tax=Pyramimonas obovata TaxID=1411642 RepID=A0A7S0RBS8_9CHLO